MPIRRGVGGVREIWEGLGEVPVVAAGAAAHGDDGLVGIVLELLVVVEGGEEISVGKLLDGGVVPVDAEAAGQADGPSVDRLGTVFTDVREEQAGVVVGLGGVWPGGGGDGGLFDGGLEVGDVVVRVVERRRGRLHDDAEGNIAGERGEGGRHAGAVGGAGEEERG